MQPAKLMFVVLVGNMVDDSSQRVVASEVPNVNSSFLHGFAQEANEFAVANKLMFFETSSKADHNVSALFKAIASVLCQSPEVLPARLFADYKVPRSPDSKVYFQTSQSSQLASFPALPDHQRLQFPATCMPYLRMYTRCLFPRICRQPHVPDRRQC